MKKNMNLCCRYKILVAKGLKYKISTLMAVSCFFWVINKRK